MILLFSLQVQDVTMEIQDLLQWLENTDLRLSSSKTAWSMPDSASERLNAHLVKWTRFSTVKIKRKVKHFQPSKKTFFFLLLTHKGVVQ